MTWWYESWIFVNKNIQTDNTPVCHIYEKLGNKNLTNGLRDGEYLFTSTYRTYPQLMEIVCRIIREYLVKPRRDLHDNWFYLGCVFVSIRKVTVAMTYTYRFSSRKITILHVFKSRQCCTDWCQHWYTHWLDLYCILC